MYCQKNIVKKCFQTLKMFFLKWGFWKSQLSALIFHQILDLEDWKVSHLKSFIFFFEDENKRAKMLHHVPPGKCYEVRTQTLNAFSRNEIFWNFNFILLYMSVKFWPSRLEQVSFNCQFYLVSHRGDNFISMRWGLLRYTYTYDNKWFTFYLRYNWIPVDRISFHK